MRLRGSLPAVIASSVAMAAVAAACSGGGDAGGTTATSTGTGDETSSASGAGGSPGTGGALGGSFAVSGQGGGSTQTLTIEPVDPVLDVEGMPETLAFTAKLDGGEAPSDVVWLLDPDLVGYVDAAGVFHSNGFTAGVTKVRATFGDLVAETELTVRVTLEENPGNVSQADRTLLEAGGSADTAFRWLYPYDETVFPRGLTGPTMQFAGAAADAAMVSVTFSNFSYKAFFGASAPTRIDFPPEVWKAITLGVGPSEDVKVDVTKLSAGAATGPATETWRIAPGSLKGIVYYNTYSSGGAVKRIRPGQQAETFIAGCTVCHSVASKGTVLAAGVNWATNNPVDSGTFDLNADGTQSQRFLDADGRRFSFAALTPDGAFALTSAVPGSGPIIRGLAGAMPSTLVDTATGLEIAVPTFSALVTNAVTPVFSHDGTRVAFNHQQGDGKTLAAMDVDLGQTPPAFSNLQPLATAAGAVAAWPSFLADSEAVVYQDGSSFDTAGYCGAPSYANLRMVDLPTKTVVSLDRLNGLEGGATYLPFGAAEEQDLNYEPSVLPVPVGGYFWVVFTSRRAYGNTIGPGGTVATGDNKWGTCNPEVPSPRKKLWVAAIDVSYPGSADPSHPAFYLPGQELETGNMRAFAALEPCKQPPVDPANPTPAEQCEFDFECCDGKKCLPTGDVDANGAPIKICKDVPQSDCSELGGACVTAADCCDPSYLCINGYCAQSTPD